MALPPAALDNLRAILESDATTAERIASLRQNLLGISLTCCDASDMDAETPAFETADLAVYLIDTSEHCVRLTTNPAAATGLIVAQKR